MLPDEDRFLKVCQFPVRPSDVIDLYLLFRTLSVTKASITNATMTTRMMAQKAQRLQMQRVQSLGTYPRR
jgi:hypothetical protein